MINEPYQIFMVEVKDKSQIEQMGTKEKFWWFRDTKTGEVWLFKYNRPNTGEDWSEKIASEIATLLRLPHAVTELAKCEDKRGIISKDFTQRLANGALVHGNELLAEVDSSYPKEQYRGVSKHSISNIAKILSEYFVVGLPQGYSYNAGINNTVDLFLGYLLLDAVIGNTDRHHENWGVLVSLDEPKGIELAPTFDHASSLGRELTEGERERLLIGKNYNANIESYAQKAISAVYLKDDDSKPLSTFEAFVEFSRYAPEAKKVWLDKLRGILDDSFKECVNRVPKHLLSSESAEFVYQLLMYNKRYLLNL